MSKTETQSEALSIAEEFEACGILDAIPSINEICQAAIELRRLDAENKQLNVALDEWMEKTHWVQDTAQVLELGMHRADVLRARIESLKALPVAGQCRWKGEKTWGNCAVEHVQMVLADPRFAADGYEVRYLYAAPQAAAKNGGAA